MSEINEPTWLDQKEPTKTNDVPFPEAKRRSPAPSSQTTVPQLPGYLQPKCVQNTLSILILAVCVLMVFFIVDVIITTNISSYDLADFFVLIYIVLFSALLFSYELMWWIAIDKLNVAIRKNFGFFYGIVGKAMYIIFVACFCLGMDNDIVDMVWLKWIAAISWWAIAFLMIMLRITRPELVDNYSPPTGGLADEEIGGIS